MSTVGAPQRTPDRRSPAPAVDARPTLRLVEHGRARRRVPPVALGVLGGLVLFAVLFALAAFQALLVDSQQRLDRLDRQVAAEQARYQRLRLETAQLESPERIVAEATARLGMVPAEGTAYLSPPAEALAGTVLGEAVGGRGAPAGVAAGGIAGDDDAEGIAGSDDADDRVRAGAADWAEVKPYLGDGP